jgi:putative ABC transport system substrate-binding protein
MQRRDFLTLLGGAAAVPIARPLAARAQQAEPKRRLGFLSGLSADDPETRARLGAFLAELQRLSWIDGRNLRIDYRWGASDPEHIRRHVGEVIALAPDVILVNGTEAAGPLRQATRRVPVVFVQVSDPVGAGLVASLAQPGENVTGFANIEYGMTGKWLELLKEIAPGVTRVAVLRDATNPTGIAQLAAMHAVAPSLGVVVSPLNVRDADEIERDIAEFARRGDGDGLVLTVGVLGIRHRDLVVALAARHRLPAVYPFRFAVTGGGLVSLGSDATDTYRRAAGYVDRILRGEKPADLPVQNPVKFELAINLKTANALGLTVPPTLLARADAVIE